VELSLKIEAPPKPYMRSCASGSVGYFQRAKDRKDNRAGFLELTLVDIYPIEYSKNKALLFNKINNNKI
jgi:hypothetical protein